MDNVVVTGASRGIGLAIAARLAREGFRVLGVARKRNEAFDKAEAEAAKAGVGALRFEPFDLGEIDAIPVFVRQLRARRGPIYGLVNNAGIGTEGLLATMANADIEALIRLNTLSPIVLTKYVVRGMMAEGRGRVVNISSIVASTGYNGLSVYAASKAALVGFTKSLAREVGRVGVNVNAIAPGFVATEMTRGLDAEARARIVARSALRRLAEAEDVAAMAAFLMGEGGRNISGAVMTVDAGGTA
jgi:3-oxoacyl-[acyl-carrier protein] reductase